MSLSKQEFDTLLRLIGRTQETELNCEQCLALVAEFAEQKLSNKSVREGLKAVEQHLSVCDECQEEFVALRKTLEHLRDVSDE